MQSLLLLLSRIVHFAQCRACRHSDIRGAINHLRSRIAILRIRCVLRFALRFSPETRAFGRLMRSCSYDCARKCGDSVPLALIAAYRPRMRTALLRTPTPRAMLARATASLRGVMRPQSFAGAGFIVLAGFLLAATGLSLAASYYTATHVHAFAAYMREH